MRFTALLFLAALAGALVCAQDASTDLTQDAPAQDTVTPTPDEKTSASPQETITTAQEISAAAQKTTKFTSGWQGSSPLSSLKEKALVLSEYVIGGGGKGLHGSIQGGKQLIEAGIEGAQRLRKKYSPVRLWS
ncbi:PREDICTED: extracellular glycoprotein lacritin-like [Galeopterus variegatus]|uniref:Extracellular glycoprotein lacritin-like n=1 Tax=Galeopterus variegatus TaxID=482537 RepID=A0ABM0S967_GALVR|nr:PREDICTED: extracellular glycoprotein lacritin-like [Galeopterus variegatus]XP_008589408.1 PREDICTED: extracellular glycoprotein lacritin-like [Galeopterus variegatus]